MSQFIDEFKTFINRGNAIDLAVGVIIGTVFGKLVTSLVSDIIMPPLGLLLGGIDFANFSWILKPAEGNQPAVAVKYGLFINNIIDFLIVALTIFTIVRVINKLKKTDEPAKAAKDAEVTLLAEIRDLLKSK
jgi:large conductance mechanosensitive channel